MKRGRYPQYRFFEVLREFICDGYSKTLLHPATARQDCSWLPEHGFEFAGLDGDGMYSSSAWVRHQDKTIAAEVKIYTHNGRATGNGLAVVQGLRLDKIVKAIRNDAQLQACKLELLFDNAGKNGALIINDNIVLQFYAAARAGAGNHYICTIESDFFFDEHAHQQRIATYAARLLHSYSLQQLLCDKTSARRCRKLSALFGTSTSGKRR